MSRFSKDISAAHIREKNILNNKIREINSFIERNDATKKRLNSQKVTIFETKQMEKLDIKNSEYAVELEKLTQRIKNIDLGICDSEMKDGMDEERERINKTNEKMKSKHIQKKEKDIEDKKMVKKSFQLTGFSRESNDNNEWFMNKQLERFYSICNGIPPRILGKLKEMPNNKGYIWKGIYFYGEQPAEVGKPVVMFETLYNGTLRIHETTESFTIIFEKQGKNRKELVSKTVRAKISKGLLVL